MQADGRLPPAEQRGYKHVGDALMRVAREEGVLTYWRGCTPTVVRAIVVSVTQVAGYDQVCRQKMGAPQCCLPQLWAIFLRSMGLGNV